MIMKAKRPTSGGGETPGALDEHGSSATLDAQTVMLRVRSRPGGVALACARSLYRQNWGEQKPHPACASSNPWSPPVQWRLDPIWATLGTGWVFGPGWHATSARAMIAIVSLRAVVFTGD